MKAVGKLLVSVFLMLCLLPTHGAWARVLQPATLRRPQTLANEVAFNFIKKRWVIRFHQSITSVPRMKGPGGKSLPNGAALALGQETNGWCKEVPSLCLEPKYIFNDVPGGWLELHLFAEKNGERQPVVALDPKTGLRRFNPARIDENGITVPPQRDKKGGIVSTGGYSLTAEVEASRIGYGLATIVNPDATVAWVLDLTEEQLQAMAEFEKDFAGRNDDIPPPPPPSPPPPIPSQQIRVEGSTLFVPRFMKPQATGSFFFAQTKVGWCTSAPCGGTDEFVDNGTEFQISICSIPLNDKRFNGGVSTRGDGFIDNWMNLFPDNLGAGVKIQGTSYVLDMTDQQIASACH